MQRNIRIAAIVIMLIVVFVIELLTPLGYVEWVLYFIPFILASRLGGRFSMFSFSALITMLIAAGFFLSPGGTPPAIAVSNRFFGILAILLMTYVIAQRMRAEEEIRHLAHHDPLTGLPNRRLFGDIADIELARARRNLKRAGILYLDLDGFKEINDELGHEAGDQLLQQVAARLKGQLRRVDAVARMGGDEFNILLADLNTAEEASVIAKKIIAAFQQPYSIDGHERQVTISIGGSIYPDDGHDMDTLLKHADKALYQAKAQGKNAFRLHRF